MAISPDRKPELNLEQKVAVATSMYLGKKRGRLVSSELTRTPAEVKDGETVFEPDSLGGIKRVLTQSKGKWHEIYLFGPINNRDRELIARYFGLDQTSQPRELTDSVANMSFQRKLLITNEQKGGAS